MQLKDLLNEYKCRMSVTNDYIAEHVGVNKLKSFLICWGQM